jgi:hypothetical protein
MVMRGLLNRVTGVVPLSGLVVWIIPAESSPGVQLKVRMERVARQDPRGQQGLHGRLARHVLQDQPDLHVQLGQPGAGPRWRLRGGSIRRGTSSARRTAGLKTGRAIAVSSAMLV